MKIHLVRADHHIRDFLRKIALPFSRFAIFLVYFWFGALKLFDLSPANPLVGDLLARTMPFVSFHNFMIGFALFEMLIGIIFLIHGLERLAIFLLMVHMIMTIMPLFMLPSITWSGFLVPTLEGQYIIKNALIIATAVGIAAHTHLRPMKDVKIPLTS